MHTYLHTYAMYIRTYIHMYICLYKTNVLSLSGIYTYKKFIEVFIILQINKALELMEQLRQRMGVVIVGPSGSGKSTLWKILRLALTKLGQSVKQYVMNPKAMPRTQVDKF